MSTERNDGGPAFPTPWAGGSATEGGMSLRDYFAGQALLGQISNTEPVVPCGMSFEEWASNVAESSYLYADAMLAAREGGAA